MKRELKLTNHHLPDLTSLFVYEMGKMMEENFKLSQSLDALVPNENQRKLDQVIETSLVPVGMHIHVLCYGGTGSGKTWGCLVKVLKGLLSHPNANALIVRKHLKEARAGTWVDTLKILREYDVPVAQINKTDLRITFPNGSEMWFCSDEALVPYNSDKADALGGTQFSYALVEECDGISDSLVKTLTGRMRQNVGVERKLILYTTNPPDKQSWVYRRFFELHKPDDPESRWRAVFMPMEGNKEYIGEGYIQSVTEDYSEDPNFYRRMREGQFGIITRGLPYFQKDFQPNVHVYRGEEPLAWARGQVMLRGWDPGYRGTGLVVVQDDLRLRQIRVFRAVLAQEVFLESFLDEILPELDSQFPGAEWVDYIDPAARQKSTLSKKTVLDVMRTRGLNPKYSLATRSLSTGLNIINEQLRAFLRQRPTLLIDERAEVLVSAFMGGYCNVKNPNRSDPEPIPFKDGYYDHIMDAFRYVMVNIRKPGQLKNPDAVGNRNQWVEVGDEGPLRVYDSGTGQSFRPGPRKNGAPAQATPLRNRSMFRR